MSNNEPVVWSLRDIVESVDESNPDGIFFVQIPKFQRSIVWTENQIKRLVDSIYRGYPIGSLLAYKTEMTRGNKIVLQLVDGLQRVTAISRFLSAPLRYTPIEDIVGKEFLGVCSECIFGNQDEDNISAVSRLVRSWFDKVTELEYGGAFSFNRLAVDIAGEDKNALKALIDLNLETQMGDRLLGFVLEDVKKARQYKVPVNIYSGPIENVPTIFERINSQGAQLSKYEILAASWSHTSVAVENPEVIEAIADKYRLMIQNGYEIEGFDEDNSESSEYNLYEYLFGLGKVLAKQFPTLFHSSDSPDENSPVAFQIMTVIYQLPVAKMGQLSDKLPRLVNGKINVSRFEDAVMEACQKVETSLAQYLTLRLNEKSVGPSGVSQNQAISFVTSYLANCFDAEFEVHDRKLGDIIAENVPAHFLIDLLRGTWSGSGDSTLFERTWETLSGTKNSRPAMRADSHYTRRVGSKSLETAFDVWHNSQLDARQKERARYPKETKPVLKFIYSSLVTSQEDKGVEFELEHVYPVAILKKIILDNSLDGLPMAAVGNLMLLPKKINRIKKENLLGDHLFGQSTSPKIEIDDFEIAQLQRYLIAPALKDISSETTFALDSESFKEFCLMRSKAMSDHLIRSLKLN